MEIDEDWKMFETWSAERHKYESKVEFMVNFDVRDYSWWQLIICLITWSL